MTEDKIFTILLVDDEEPILKALIRLFKPFGHKVISTTDAEHGLKILTEEEIALIISDQRMPKMSGVDFLKKAKKIAPNTIRILLTGYIDMSVSVDAINQGEIKYFLSKPWDDELLISRVTESLDLYSTIKEKEELRKLTIEQNKQLQNYNETLQQKVNEQTAKLQERHKELNRSFMETIKAFSSFIEMRHKEVGSHSQRVAQLVKNLLDYYGLKPKQYQDIIVSAYLHDIGKISFPDNVLKKPTDDFNRQELEMFRKHPILGQSCVYNISGFEEIGVIIRSHHENYDGSGFPDGLVGDQIPMGSKIIRICDYFDHFAFKRGYPDLQTLNNATAMLVKNSGTLFCPETVKRFIDHDVARVLYHEETRNFDIVTPSELEEGMVVANDIYSRNGMFLLPKGAKLSKGMASRIKKIHSIDPITCEIRVYNNSYTERKADVVI